MTEYIAGRSYNRRFPFSLRGLFPSLISSRKSRAFSLVELVLVVAIIGILTVVMMPAFVKSIRGNRLRSSARAVVMSGKYARSMAVMRQKDVRVTFDISAGKIEVTDAAVVQKTDEFDEEDIADFGNDAFLDDPGYGDNAFAEDILDEGVSHNVGDHSKQAGASRVYLLNELEDTRIESVEVGESAEYTEGTIDVLYRRNGRCTSYTVTLIDKHESRLVVKVDALGGASVDGS